MNKPDLIDNCTYRMGTIPRPKIDVAVNLIIEMMSDRLEKGERIEIRQFGSFNIRVRKAKMGRNPKTGVAVQIAEKRVPHFKPGKEMRERVNHG
jgi:integration host factor subunit beta